MIVTFELPEDIAQALPFEHRSPDDAAQEAIAAEGYRSGVLSESQLKRLLNLPSRFAVHDWLRQRQIPYQYSEADLESDLANLSALGLR